MSVAMSRSLQIANEAAAHFSRPGAGLFVPSGAPLMPHQNAVSDGNDGVEYTSLEEAFPDVAPMVTPTGSLVLVMMRQAPLYTPAGFELPKSTVQTEKDNNQVARVIALGPLAFHNRDTHREWPEGAWCKPGDYVRVPKYQGDLWTVPYARTTRRWHQPTESYIEETKLDYVRFAMFKDLAITGRYDEADVLRIRAFL